jgi:hypothetical protein
MEQILINLVAGAVGGVGAGKASPTFDLGMIGNSRRRGARPDRNIIVASGHGRSAVGQSEHRRHHLTGDRRRRRRRHTHGDHRRNQEQSCRLMPASFDWDMRLRYPVVTTGTGIRHPIICLWRASHETNSLRCHNYGLSDWPGNYAGNVCRQSGWQERQATGWCGAQQFPQKMQAGIMLAKGGERGRQETLGRG